LTVLVDGTCSGKQSNVQIFIDGVSRGTVQPGGSGVSMTVSIGDHTISARSQQGTTWGPITRAVGSSGATERLTCS